MADGLRLSALLPERLDATGEEARRIMCENEEIGGMKLAWDYIGSELQGALKAALDCDLMEVLAKSWATAQLLNEYADRARHPPGERAVIELGAHQLSRELHPVVAVTIGSCPCVELEFSFIVTADFSGVKLSIADGHITGGEAGDAAATGQLSFKGVPLHQPEKSRKVALGGPFAFSAPGIAIPGLAA